MELSRRDQNSQFAIQEVIQGAALEKVEDKIFRAYEEPRGSSLYQQLRDRHQQGDGAAMVSTGMGFIGFTSFVDDLDVLDTTLAALDERLLDRDDEAPPTGLR
jgi:hypothetical protein